MVHRPFLVARGGRTFLFVLAAAVVDGRLPKARWIAPALALAVAGWRVVDAHYDWVVRWNPALRGSVARTDYRIDILLFGCAAALVWDDPRARALFQRIGGAALAVLAIAAAVCCQVWTPPGDLTIAAISMALLPVATVAKPRSWAGRILEVPLLAWIGRMSYSLYIWQQLFLPARATGIWQRTPWNLAAVFACAAASYYLVERPAIGFGRRLRLRGSNASAAAVGSPARWNRESVC